jgi:hypothetical protein
MCVEVNVKFQLGINTNFAAKVLLILTQ